MKAEQSENFIVLGFLGSLCSHKMLGQSALVVFQNAKNIIFSPTLYLIAHSGNIKHPMRLSLGEYCPSAVPEIMRMTRLAK